MGANEQPQPIILTSENGTGNAKWTAEVKPSRWSDVNTPICYAATWWEAVDGLRKALASQGVTGQLEIQSRVIPTVCFSSDKDRRAYLEGSFPPGPMGSTLASLRDERIEACYHCLKELERIRAGL